MQMSKNVAGHLSPQKIGLVLDTSLDPMDGVQQYVIGIGEWLRARGHDVHYLVGETHQRDLPNVHSLARNIKVRFNGNRTTIPLPTSRRKLRRFLWQERFDILHIQSPHSPFMGQRLILAASPKTVIFSTFHILPDGWLPIIGTKLLGWWLRPSLKRIDKMVTASSSVATFAKKAFGLDSEQLPMVFEYDLFHEAAPLPEYDDNVPTILFFGRLVPRKGCAKLLEAVSLLKARAAVPAFKVIIAGKGELRAELEAYVRNHVLADLVTFTGYVDEALKPSLYASSYITVFPSRGGESFGIVLLEGMASGRAAVLTGDNPGYRAVMESGPDLLFDPLDANQLADKLQTLLTDKAKHDAAAAWGEAYSRQFDIDDVGIRLEKMYEELLTAKTVR
jgi:phosphatidylinositol alpha-mannosyltransferase